MRHDETVSVTTSCIPLWMIFWKLKPNMQLGAQTSSMRTTRPFNRDAHQLYTVNPWAETNPANQNESLVSVSNTNPKFSPKNLTKNLDLTCRVCRVHVGWMAICVFFVEPQNRITSAQVASQNLRWKVQSKETAFDSQEPKYVSLPSDPGTFKIAGQLVQKRIVWHKWVKLFLKSTLKGRIRKSRMFSWKAICFDKTLS